MVQWLRLKQQGCALKKQQQENETTKQHHIDKEHLPHSGDGILGSSGCIGDACITAKICDEHVKSILWLQYLMLRC